MGKTSFSGPMYVGGALVSPPYIPAIGPDQRYFYVTADGDSAPADGRKWTSAFSTIEEGYAALRSNKHDVLVLSANGAHTLSDELVITKNRIHVISADFGLRHMGQSTKINLGVTTGSAIAAINNQGVRNSFHGLKITSSDTLATSLYGVCEAGEFSLWEGCEILKTTDLDQTAAAEVLMVGDSPLWRYCAIGNQIYQPSVARQNMLFSRSLSPTGYVARDVQFERCWFLSFATSATFVNLRATTNDIERLAYFERCLFASKKGSTTQALVAGIASALTDAEIILHDCAVQNITDVAAGSRGVFTTSPTPSATGTETVQVTTT